MISKMASKWTGQKLNKCERRALRKQAKKLLALKNEENGLEISDEPTRHLVVGNGGLLCGMARSCLLKLFGKHGSIESLCLIPDKSFSLVSYKTTNEAHNAHEKIHGRTLECPSEVPKNGVTLYLAFLKENFTDKSDLMKWNVRPVLPSQPDLHPLGLVIVEDFISDEQENELIGFFKMGDVSDKSMKHRNVKHFGYEFIYGKNNIDKDNPLQDSIPDICSTITEKMKANGLVEWMPDQLTVNEYTVGQGIPPHVDTHSAFTDGIISLSLGSQVVMDFCHPDGQEISMILPPRSLLVMKGESRYLWTHGITPRKTDIVIDTTEDSNDDPRSKLTLKERGFRISLTFRKILREPCKCSFPSKCDSQGYNNGKEEDGTQKNSVFVPSNESEARQLEADHVYEVYDEIADHFSDTRHSPWPKVAKFLRELQSGSLVADVGCGNGKYLGVNKELVTFGSDRSVNLIKICRDRGHCGIVCDVLSLPYRSNSFDACISIAVIHHLSTTERRANAIKELVRIVKPHGCVLIYVWALEQDKDPANGGPLDEKKDKERRLREEIASVSSEAAFAENDKGAECKDAVKGNQSTVEIDQEQESAAEPRTGKSEICEEDMTEAETRVNTRDSSSKNKFGRNCDVASEKTRSTIAINESRNVFKQQDLLVPWHFRGGKGGKGSAESSNELSKIDSNDKATNLSQIYHRFYHVFVEGELEELCSVIKGVKVVKSYHDRGNWCVIIQKYE